MAVQIPFLLAVTSLVRIGMPGGSAGDRGEGEGKGGPGGNGGNGEVGGHPRQASRCRPVQAADGARG